MNVNDITKLKFHTYFIAIGIVIIGTLLASIIIAGILSFLRNLGLSTDEQFAWLRPTLIWGVIIIIVAGTTCFLNDMTSNLGESNLRFLLLWPLTIAGISVIGNFIVSTPLFDINDVCIMGISLITIAVIKRKDIIAFTKRLT